MNNVDFIYQLIRKDLTADGWKQEDIEIAIADCVQERVETGANDNTLCTKELSYLKKDSLQIIAIVIGKNKSRLSLDKLVDVSKHWLSIILNFVKKAFCWLIHVIKILLRGIFKFFKRIWKYLLGVIILGALIGGCFALHDYYTNTYEPEQAAEKIRKEFKEAPEGSSLKILYAERLLEKDRDWSLEGLPIYKNHLLLDLRQDAFEVIEQAAYNGNAECQCLLGHIYLFAQESYTYGKYDYEKSTYWYKEAANNGNIIAYNNLGLAYKEGRGVEVDMRKAVEWLKKGAEAGNDYAQANYGDLFMEGVKIKVGTHKETKTTSEYKSERIREYWDYARGQMMYVYCETVDDYETLVPEDIEQAKSWWQKAAAQGNKHAKERLQKVYN